MQNTKLYQFSLIFENQIILMQDENLSKLKTELIDLFEEALADHGQNKRVGTVYANLIASSKPLTQDQLAEDLDISNSTVSRALKSLENKFGLINSKRLTGTKKAEYMISEKTFEKFFTIGIIELFQLYQKFRSRIDLMQKRFEPNLDRKSQSKVVNYYADILDSLGESINFHTDKLGELTSLLRDRSY